MSGSGVTTAGDEMAGGARNALIVASSDYADPELRQLQTPAADARALEAVLRDPGIGGFEVRTLLNRPNQEVTLAVEEFFADREPDDMLLVHFSCHGIKDEDGELYFAMANSMLRRLASTAVAANFVNQRMNRSRSKRVVLLLDCCYAGAFERGMMARAAGGAVGIEEQFAGGRGRAVITASDAMQYAYEGGELAVTGELAPSVFTSALVSGLETGEADRDQDGQVALDELYDYIYDKVQAVTPNQTPCKWTYGVRGELFIARRSRPVTTPSPLPDDIRQAIESRLASVRVGAVQELEPLLHGRHQGLALAARLTLEQLTDDDSRAVSAAATAALGTEEPPAVPPSLEPSATLVDFGRLTQHSRSPELSVRLSNAGGENLNAHASTQASWVRLRQVGDELYVAVDTGTVSEHEGAITVDSDGGSATIQVKASVVPALQPAPEPAAIFGAAETVRADPVPAEAVPAADSSARPGRRPDAASGEAVPAPARKMDAAETAPRPAPRARSGAAMLLGAGFIVLAVALFIIGLDALIPKISTAMWPWWAALIACITGIAATLGALRQYSVYAIIITWPLAWTLIWSISIIGFWNSTSTTGTAVLRVEAIAGAVVNAALCLWVIVLLSRRNRNVDQFLAIFLGCFTVALVLAGIAIGKQSGPIWYATGIAAIAAALVLPLALLRAHHSAAATT
jgi:Caspase domain